MENMQEALRQLLNRWLPRGGFARSVSILVSGTALAQVIATAASPILTRIYKPADFGALQVFNSLVLLIVIAASGRYELAILLPEDEQSSIDILGLAILCVFLTTMITVAIVIICHFHWMLPASMSVLRGYLWLLPLSVLGGGLYQALSYWAMRQNDYSQIAKSKFTQAGSQVATQLGVGFVAHGPLGLLVGDSIGRMAGSGRFFRDLWRSSSDSLYAIRFSRMIKLARRYRDYPLISMWGALINLSGLALPSLFLAEYFGAQGTGWFALVYRVLGVPSALIGLSISQVYASEAAKLSRSNPNRLMYIFLKTTRRMIYLGLAPCIVFMIISPWAFQLIFGQPWREAGVYARYLTLMFFTGFINSPVQWTLVILERQRAQFTWDISKLAITIFTMTVPHYMGYGPRVVLLSFGSAMTVMYVIHWTQSYFAIGHRVKLAEVELAKTKAV